MDAEYNRDDWIELYFDMGLKYKDIVEVLATYQGVIITERHLKRVLRGKGLFRRKYYSDIGDVVQYLQSLVQTSGMLHGYRWMYERCKLNGIRCKKKDVRFILGILDPDGVIQRRRRRLLRRSYSSKGPNYIWHLDSYDYLKRFGICINGCIDGFSRHVIWMNAYKTSSDASVIGGYFINAVQSKQGCLCVLRGVFGTENVRVRVFQQYLRRHSTDERAGLLSYLQGASTANQRIEYWWSVLRRECMDFWILLFQEFQADGDFSGTFLDIHLVRYCFLHLIQDDLDSFVHTWNNHYIRPVRNIRGPSGRPPVLYNLPALYSTTDYLTDVLQVDIETCKAECTFRDLIPCDVDIYNVCNVISAQINIDIPQDAYMAVEVYKQLRMEVLSIL